jgi:hypothetical protein
LIPFSHLNYTPVTNGIPIEVLIWPGKFIIFDGFLIHCGNIAVDKDGKSNNYQSDVQSGNDHRCIHF